MNSIRKDFSIGREIESSRWLSEKGKTIGKTPLEKEFNAYLATITETFYRIERDMLAEDIEVNCEALIERYNKQEKDDNTPSSLFAAMDLHNKEMLQLKEMGMIARETHSRYLTTKKYLQGYLKITYKKDDIRLKNLDSKFINGFEHWLRVNVTCANNTLMKHIKNLKKIANYSIKNVYLKTDPFFSYKCKSDPVARGYLSKEELTRIKDLNLNIERLNYTRNLFLLGCYTGLSFCDLINLKSADFMSDNDGNQWIIKARKKTKVVSRIPILNVAQDIINELKRTPNERDFLLSSISNQRVNGYLKEIADLAQIDKNLSFHMSRHTFATTITLANGISIESVSAQLGHTNIRQTQHYARMVDSRIINEMSKLNSMDI
jgi:integrase